jgi:hypothetical protein
MTYDSEADTRRHIATVERALLWCAAELMRRAARHDASKLGPPEKAMFDEWTPRLDEAEYGSPAYRDALEAMGPALAHHYAANDHHPEHFGVPARRSPSPEVAPIGGIFGMDLLQLVEMMCDWWAAGQRPGGIPLAESVARNAERFRYLPGGELERVLANTAASLEAGVRQG